MELVGLQQLGRHAGVLRANVEITVLKRLFHQDLVDRYTKPTDWSPCERLKEGQEFVSRGVNMPTGFCSWAWADIQKYVMVLARGGSFAGVKSGVFITCKGYPLSWRTPKI